MPIATLLLPLVLPITQTVGMAPLTLRVKVRTDTNQREVCVVVDGPEYLRSCYPPQGITKTIDFLLRMPGEYRVFAVSDTYRTPEVTVRVIGMGEPQ